MKTFVRFIAMLSLAFLLLPSQASACDSTWAIDIGSPVDLGGGNFGVDIEVCIGDGGSLDGFTTTFPSLNIVSFTPSSISAGGNTANGSVSGGTLDYSYTGGGMFVPGFDNTCFNYSVVVNGDPAGTDVNFSGINCETDDCPSSCAFIGGNDGTSTVPFGTQSVTCGETFVDPGGTGGNYANNADLSYLICSGDAAQPVTLDFSVFDIESGFDNLIIYDNNTNSGSSTTYTGTTSPGTVTSTNGTGCLFVEFTSDGSVTDLGWEAAVVCGTPLTCGDTFTDGGGNYSNNANEEYLICPSDPTNPVVVDFSAFNLENGADFMVIYDNNTNSGGSTSYTGTNSPGTVAATNPSGCLYVVFTSDGSGTASGWSASVTCPILPDYVCGDTFTDTGGAGGNYSNNANEEYLICSDDPANPVTLDFSVFDIESGFDNLIIYDNDNASGSSTNYTGTTSPGIVTSTNGTGCLYVVFTSDGSVTDIGWAATVECSSPTPLACGDAFTDSGGVAGNYPNDANEEYIICPADPSTPVTLNFSVFDLRNNDNLTIYNGDNTGAPLVGTYSNTSPGIITSTDATGCLFVVFTSNGSGVAAGWEAAVVCCTDITFADASNCSGGTSTVTVTITGGTAPYTLTNTGAGTLSTTTVATDGGTVDITGLIDGDTYSFDVADASGCPGSHSGTFSDTTPPTALCQDLFVQINPDTGTAEIDPADIDNGSSDACSAVTLAVSPATLDCSNIGENTVTLTVTDASGNSATCTATVTVLELPVAFAR